MKSFISSLDLEKKNFDLSPKFELTVFELTVSDLYNTTRHTEYQYPALYVILTPLTPLESVH